MLSTVDQTRGCICMEASQRESMDHTLAIQETVHENRESIPTGVVTNVMRECQQAYKALPKLWKVHYCEVWAVSKNSVDSDIKTRIVEECATLNPDHWYWFKVLDTGKIPPADRQRDSHQRELGRAQRRWSRARHHEGRAPSEAGARGGVRNLREEGSPEGPVCLYTPHKLRAEPHTLVDNMDMSGTQT